MTLLLPLPSLHDLFAQLAATPEPYPDALRRQRRASFVAEIRERRRAAIDPSEFHFPKGVTREQDERNSRPFPL